MFLEGNIISGQFDEKMNEFSMQGLKHFYFQSTLKQSQLDLLYRYLQKHEDEREGQIITLFDQMPLRLSQEEIKLLLGDLKTIHSMFH